MNNDKKRHCPVCGGFTRLYYGNPVKDGLCRNCKKDFDNHKIVLDDNGQYVMSNNSKVTTSKRKEDRQILDYILNEIEFKIDCLFVCEKCSKKMKEVSNFCPSCGTNISTVFQSRKKSFELGEKYYI